MSIRKTQIVIIGGGAAGLELATKLGRKYGRRRHDIILVDRQRTHIWKPLLHEVAAGSLDANLDEVGYRAHCHGRGYRFFNGTLAGVDTQGQKIHLAPLHDHRGKEIIAPHQIRYDVLVLAIGSVTNDFGTKGVAENCIFLDSRRDADAFRDRLLDHCLRVSRAMSVDAAADARVRIAIVGGGATGVELSAELFNAASALAYHGLEVFDEGRLDVSLIEAGPRILPALPERLATAAERQLTALGVKVRTGLRIVQSRPDGMLSTSGELIRADLQVWAAGVKGAPIAAFPPSLERNRNDQFVVRPTLQTTNDDRIFAIGDCAACVLPGQERPVPPRAQAAHQMADCAYDNIVRLLSGRPLRAFVYRDHGSLVSLSRYTTVGNLMGNLMGDLAVQGRIARFVYISLYRMHLIAVHGWARGLALLLVGRFNRIVRPAMKLH